MPPMAEIPPPMIVEEVFELRDVDARGVRRGGIFADGAEMQAGTGLIQEPPHHNRQHQCQIEEQAVAEQQLAATGIFCNPCGKMDLEKNSLRWLLSAT